MTSTRFSHEGVEGLRVGRFDIGINSSCIVYRIGDTVVDTGPPNQWPIVRRFLQERSVRNVFITHYHEDHSGNGARIQRTMGTEVYMPDDGIEPVRRGFPLRPYQRIIWGVPERFTARSISTATESRSAIRLNAIHSPGHSPDMTCYLEAQRGWLFTGDLYIASKPRFLRADEDIHAQITSLERILTHDFGIVFCAHRGVVPDGPTALRAKLDYLVSLRDEVRAMRQKGQSVRAIRRALLGRETFMSFATFFNFSKRNLVEACLVSEPLIPR
jgi:glyoxylase-like metal-dependent hydrolase (beta-lactamase superfamily II)